MPRQTPSAKRPVHLAPAWGLLALLIAGPLLAQQVPAPAKPAPPRTELQKAIEEFRTRTRDLGLRADAPGATSRRKAPRPKYHGRLFWNFRNDVLDAVPHEIVQRGGDKNLLRRNQFGFNLAGPLFIPRLYNGGRTTFLSLSYEGVRERISRSYLRTIAIEPERRGDFSQTVDPAGAPLPVYDPLTTRPNPAFDAAHPVALDNLQYLRDPFPGNRIPVERLDPVALRALRFYPLPNSNAGPFFRNNYFAVSPETNVANGMILKLEHSIGDRHRAVVETSFSNGLAGTARLLPSVADSNPPDRQFSSRRASLEYAFTRSPRTLYTASLEATVDRSTSLGEGDLDVARQLGLPASSPFPIFQVQPYVPLGRFNPESRNARALYTASAGVSTRRGKHSLRGTLELTRWQVNTFLPQSPSGLFRFAAGLTSLPGIVNTGHPFASFLLGLSERAEVSLVASPSYFRRTTGNLVLRDQVEFSKSLTLSLGLNTDLSTPRVERRNRQSTIDLRQPNPAGARPGALVAAGRGNRGRAFQPVRLRVEPSVSLAWNPRGNPKSVVRLGYARNYARIPIPYGQFGTQGFNAYPTFISPNIQLEPALRLRDGLPLRDVALPDLRPDAANNTVADYIHQDDAMPVTQALSLSMERELPGAVVVTLAASASHGRDMLIGNSAMDLNAIPIDALAFRDRLNDEAFRRTLRPFPQYQSFDLNSLLPAGRYRREAAVVRVEKRSSGGLAVAATYEFGKQRDDYSGPYGIQDYFHRDNEWSPTAGIPIQRASLNYTVDLPIGTNKPFLSFSDWRKVLVNNWSVSGMSTVNGGDPLALRPQFNNTGGVLQTLYVDAVPGVSPNVADQGPSLWFNPAAFAQPADFTPGTAPRTLSLLNPGSQNHDLSLTKRFPLDAERTVELSAVGFNFIHHANLNDPDNVIGPESAPNVNAGRIIGSRGQRVIQLGLRYSF